MKGTVKNNVLLLVTAFIWGSAFVAQSAGMDYVGPLTFNGARCLLGALLLLIVWGCVNRFHVLEDRTEKREAYLKKRAQERGDASAWERFRQVRAENRICLLTGGVACGFVLTAASALQQVGMVYTTAGKAGFLTALYIILIPICRSFFGKRISLKVWIAVCLSMIGLYLLCVDRSLSIGKGDLMILLCACFYTIHILCIDHFSPRVNGIKLSCIQFFVAGLLCMAGAFLFEQPSWKAVGAAWLPLFYAGGLSCAVAYTLQIIAQKDLDPTVASLLFSLESVFAVLMGWAVLGEEMTRREITGCIFMFAAIILSQMPSLRVSDSQEETSVL